MADNSLDRLNDRQKDVLFLVCKGFRNSEIADHVGISPRSVKGYVSQLLLIYDVSNRTELAGLIGPTAGLSAGSGEMTRRTVQSDIALDVEFLAY